MYGKPAAADESKEIIHCFLIESSGETIGKSAFFIRQCIGFIIKHMLKITCHII